MRSQARRSQDPLEIDGTEVVPRDFFIRVVSPRLRNPKGRDLVALRVEVEGTKNGAQGGVRYDLLDDYDAEHGVTAMMRTTGYSLAITSLMQVDGRVTEHGVTTPDEGMPADGSPLLDRILAAIRAIDPEADDAAHPDRRS